MHIPDGFLNAGTWGALWGVSAVSVGYAARTAGAKQEERHVPLLGVTAAFVFAAQMINFPVGGGTSGHFMGGVLAAVLMGPLSGLLVMFTVLVVQCFVFQDGGLTALGANVFNMGIVGSAGGYYVYAAIRRVVGSSRRGRATAAFAAGLVSMVAASAFCAAELAASGVIPLRIVLPTMTGVHAVIGVGEGFITVVALEAIGRVRPDLLALRKV